MVPWVQEGIRSRCSQSEARSVRAESWETEGFYGKQPTRMLLALDQRGEVRSVIIRKVALPLAAFAKPLHPLLLPPCAAVSPPRQLHGPRRYLQKIPTRWRASFEVTLRMPPEHNPEGNGVNTSAVHVCAPGAPLSGKSAP